MYYHRFTAQMYAVVSFPGVWSGNDVMHAEMYIIRLRRRAVS